jgi:3-oxoacyl-[acyl-carrier-protein] synthase III
LRSADSSHGSATRRAWFGSYHKYGNTTAATIPLLWDEAVREGKISPGDLILMVAFGAGMNWGTALLRA